MKFTLRSSSFANEGAIPVQHTCQGANTSPPLTWSDPPPGTQSFALIVDDPDAPDPDAPKMTWVHWLVYNIPGDARGMPAAATAETLPSGAREGINDWKRPGYGGPCPPVGRHRYFHKLYALDVVLPDLDRPTKPQLEAAISGHVVGDARLMGTYQKGR